MRYLVILTLIGCGSVKNDPADAQKALDSPLTIDGPQTCSIHDQISSCGATCSVCTTSNDREMPACANMVCGAVCKNAAPLCSDTSCSKTVFGFDASSEGAIVVAPAGQAMTVRAFMGSQMLAFDITGTFQQIEFRVPVCLGGNVNLMTKTLKARVYFEGGIDAGDQYYIQGSVPTPSTGNLLATMPAAHDVFVNYAAPMNVSASSNIVSTVTFRIGTFGAQFSGTIWVDDIKIE